MVFADADLNSFVGAVTAVVTAVAGAIGVLVPVVMKAWKEIAAQRKEIAAQKRRLDLFWRSRLLRGTSEGISKGLLVEQVGPESVAPEEGGFMTVALTPEAYAAYEPIRDKLVEMRKKHPDSTGTEFAEDIEERFGPWLARYVCAVLGVSEYACIVMAQSVADGGGPAELPPDSRPHRPLGGAP
jgi:hypothetical protein